MSVEKKEGQKIIPKKKQPSNIEPFLRGSIPTTNLHPLDMHSLQVNLERPFGDVSGLEKQWCFLDEVPYVSNCHQRTIYGDNDTMLVDCHPCGSSHGVVNTRKCDSGSGKGKATCSGGNIALFLLFCFYIVPWLHCSICFLCIQELQVATQRMVSECMKVHYLSQKGLFHVTATLSLYTPIA